MTLSDTLKTLNAKVTAAAAGRPVRLMGVSKNVEAGRIEEALKAGQRLFGENYVQEAKSKWAGLKAQYPDARVNLIGPLQTNKAADAVELFDRIDSVDRPKLAHALADAMKKQGRQVPVLIEVNIGAEPQKHGCLLSDFPALLDLCNQLGLKVEGVMAIPPVGQEPDGWFRDLARLAIINHLPEISMGMSSDFERAIACGSTLVRVGTALFGERHKA